MLQNEFAKTAPKTPLVLHVLVLGAGLMGQRHIAALQEVSAKVLEERGVTLEIAAVDRDQSKLDTLPPAAGKFLSLEDALAAQKPDIALMAFNDDQHMAAFKTLFKEAPELKAVLSEKPLTEYLADAQEIEPELRKRYLSMNTVINFSPVFDRINELMPDLENEFGKLTPVGYEAVWGKDRTADTRPSIGIPSEAVHALSVVSDMFAAGRLKLESGSAVTGDLSVNAKGVVYEMDALFRAQSGLPMHFHASYVFPSQQRRVTAYYETSDKTVLALEMDFDVKVAGQNKDRLRIHRIDPATGALDTGIDEYPDKIVTGAAQGALKNDRITAFISLSLLDYLTPEKDRDPALKERLSNLDAALQIQGEVEQISAGNKLLTVIRQDADPARLSPPKLPELSKTTAVDRLKRIAALKPQKAPALRKPSFS